MHVILTFNMQKKKKESLAGFESIVSLKSLSCNWMLQSLCGERWLGFLKRCMADTGHRMPLEI